MDKSKSYNPLYGFDFKVLDDPGFKEDAVREEVITPIAKALGYIVSPPNIVIRAFQLLSSRYRVC